MRNRPNITKCQWGTPCEEMKRFTEFSPCLETHFNTFSSRGGGGEVNQWFVAKLWVTILVLSPSLLQTGWIWGDNMRPVYQGVLSWVPLYYYAWIVHVFRLCMHRFLSVAVDCSRRSPELIQLLDMHTHFAISTPGKQVTIVSHTWLPPLVSQSASQYSGTSV